jgi:hypothetical protein
VDCSTLYGHHHRAISRIVKEIPDLIKTPDGQPPIRSFDIIIFSVVDFPAQQVYFGRIAMWFN